MAAAIDIERFASLSAEIEGGAAAEEVLAREGIAPEAWAESQEEWLAKLAEETAERKGSTLTERYQAAFAARLAELEKEQKARPPVAARAAPAIELPPEPDLDAPLDELAFAEPPAPPPVVLPVRAEPSREVSPWAAASSVPAASGVPAVAPALVAPGPAAFSVPAMAPALVASGPAASAPAPVRPPSDDVHASGTAPVHTITFSAPPAAGEGLPFQPSPPSLRPSPTSQPRVSGTPFRAVPADAPPVSQTQQPPRAPPGPQAPPPSLRNPPGAFPMPRLTLEQFAQLSAELASAPHATAAVCARYGLDLSGPAAEHHAWSQRFALDRPLYERFTVLYQHYAGWLAKSKR